GAVHMFAGVMTINFILSGDIAGAIGGIADAIDPESLQMAYPKAAGAVIGQHGWNLLWGGAVTLVCAFGVWSGKWTPTWIAALVGGLLDLGYFMFMDLGGYVHFVPGTVMTLVSSAAIIFSMLAHFRGDKR
ncbi:MAG: hypothetical protein AAFV80_10720, partial [Bacteroidota bacterium]